MGNEKRGIYPELKEAALDTECCANCRYFSMTDAPPPVDASVVAATVAGVVQGCCLRYPPAVFPVGQRNVIAGAELQMASISVRAVVGATDWCGEFAAHGPLQ